MKMTKIERIRDLAEELYAIELLEYHNKNHLSGSNKLRSENKQGLCRDILLLCDNKRSNLTAEVAAWVSTKDRLPELVDQYKLYSAKVLVAVGLKDSYMKLGRYRKTGLGGEWITTDNEPFTEQELITHWMPLPGPPRGCDDA